MQILPFPSAPAPHAAFIAADDLRVEAQVRSVLDDFGGLSVPVHSLSSADDLFAAGLTSFATVGVMLALEEAFDVAFPDALLTRSTFKTIHALVSALRGMMPHA